MRQASSFQSCRSETADTTLYNMLGFQAVEKLFRRSECQYENIPKVTIMDSESATSMLPIQIEVRTASETPGIDFSQKAWLEANGFIEAASILWLYE